MSNLKPSEESCGIPETSPFEKLPEANNNLSRVLSSVESCPSDNPCVNEFDRDEETDQPGTSFQRTDCPQNNQTIPTCEQEGQAETEREHTEGDQHSSVESESLTEGLAHLENVVSYRSDYRPSSGLSDSGTVGTPQSYSEDNRPSSALSELGVERRKRRQKSNQRLQCVRCCAFDFPNYATFHSHHLLHAYESFLLVSLTRLPEENSDTLSISEQMGTEQEEAEGKRSPIKLTIKLSSLKESSTTVDDSGSFNGDIDFSHYYDDNNEDLRSSLSPAEHEELDSTQEENENNNHDEVNPNTRDYSQLSSNEHHNDSQPDMQSSSSKDGHQNSHDGQAASESNDETFKGEFDTMEENRNGADHEVQPIATTKCAPCSMSFFSSEDLKNHVDSCHSEQQKCCRCEKLYEKIEDLIDHVRADHASELNQEPDQTPVPIQPKAEPTDPRPTPKLRVIPSAQLMSSAPNAVESMTMSEGSSQKLGFPMMQDPNLSNMRMNQISPSLVMNNPDLTSMMNRMNSMGPRPFVHQMNSVLSSGPASQPYHGYHQSQSGPGPRMYMNMDSHGQLPPPGSGQILQSTLQQNPGQSVRVPRPPVPHNLGSRGPPFRGGTPVQGRGRPLAPFPRNRAPIRPPVMNGMRPMQPGPPLVRKRNSGLPNAGPAEKQPRTDSDDIEVVAVKHRTSQPSLAESHGLPKLPNSISVSVKTVTAPPEKASDGGNVLASVLANRGITVTPATSESPQPNPQPNQVAASIAASLGPDVSVSPSGHLAPNRAPPPARPNHNFVAPLPPSQRPISEKDRPPRPPTVDLTVDQSQKMYTCQACKRRFPDVQKLKIHLESHINPSAAVGAPSPGGAFICNVCNCPFHSQHALEAHRQLSHPPKLNKVDSLAIPIVDLSDPGVTSRLSQLGIKTCLPVGKLASLGNGSYGIPLVSIDSRTGSSNFPLSSAILTLGTIQKLP